MKIKIAHILITSIERVTVITILILKLRKQRWVRNKKKEGTWAFRFSSQTFKKKKDSMEINPQNFWKEWQIYCIPNNTYTARNTTAVSEHHSVSMINKLYRALDSISQRTYRYISIYIDIDLYMKCFMKLCVILVQGPC